MDGSSMRYGISNYINDYEDSRLKSSATVDQSTDDPQPDLLQTERQVKQQPPH